jgi:hypothetical protein
LPHSIANVRFESSIVKILLQESYSRWLLSILDGLVAPIINTIATINEPACHCQQTLMNHWSSLDVATCDTPIIRRIMAASEHKHAAVRTQ